MVTLRPLLSIKTIAGQKAKIYAKFEVTLPLMAVLWTPPVLDPRTCHLPSALERDPYFCRDPEKKIDSPANETATTTMSTTTHDRYAMTTDGSLPSSLPDTTSLPDTKGDAMTLLPDTVKSTTPLLLGVETTASKPINSAELILQSTAAPTESSSNALSSHNNNNSLSSSSLLPLKKEKENQRGFSTSIRFHNYITPSLQTPLLFTKTTAKSSNHNNSTNRTIHSNSSFLPYHPISSTIQQKMQRQQRCITQSISRHSSSPNYYPNKRYTTLRRGKLVGVVATTFLFLFSGATSSSTFGNRRHSSAWGIKDENQETNPLETEYDTTHLDDENIMTKPLEFEHGTTTLAFTFQGGIIAAVDSRASLGNFVGSKTVEKVLPINSHMLGTMAGGAADCSHWIRKIQAEAELFQLTENRRMSVTRASKILSDYLYNQRHLDLSVGTMIMGFNDQEGVIYYVDNTGVRLKGTMFSVGSGSTYALGILDSQKQRLEELTTEEAINLAIRAVRHATFRDAYSGGYINVFLITAKDGWKKVFREDLAAKNQKKK